MTRNWLFGLIILCAVPSNARADVFTLPKSEARIITTAVVTRSPYGFDDSGHVVDISNYNQSQIYVQGEYGVTDDLTVIAAPSFRDIDVEGAPSTTGFGYTELGGRYRVFHRDHWSIAVQGLVRLPGSGKSQNVAQLANSSTDFDGRVGVAYATSTAFASVEGGYRFRSGDLPNEFHLEVNSGVHVAPKLMVLGALYNTFSDGPGQGIFNRSYRYGDGSLSAAYQISKQLTLQAGYTATLYGRNALRQRGVFAGFWYSF